MNGYAKDTVELGPDETFGARLIADRLYSYWQNDKNQTILQGSKTIFALESAFLMKVAFSDGKQPNFNGSSKKEIKYTQPQSKALRILLHP